MNNIVVFLAPLTCSQYTLKVICPQSCSQMELVSLVAFTINLKVCWITKATSDILTIKEDGNDATETVKESHFFCVFSPDVRWMYVLVF